MAPPRSIVVTYPMSDEQKEAALMMKNDLAYTVSDVARSFLEQDYPVDTCQIRELFETDFEYDPVAALADQGL